MEFLVKRKIIQNYYIIKKCSVRPKIVEKKFPEDLDVENEPFEEISSYIPIYLYTICTCNP